MTLEELFDKLKPGESVIISHNIYIKEDGILRQYAITQRGNYININAGNIESNPPAGHYKVTNLYVDSATGKLQVEYDNTPS